MSEFFAGLVIFLLFAAVPVTMAYRRIDLGTSTVAIGGALVIYSLIGYGPALWFVLLWLLFALLLTLNITNFRRENISAKLFDLYKTMLPSISDTEREALEAGSVSWDGELFTGLPDWDQLMSRPPPGLTEDEQAFLDGPVEELCEMVDDWQITHELSDLPPEVWDYLRKERFFAMIIPQEYGGLGFSAIANSAVLAKICGRSVVTATTVAVPNSLGPGELLTHYGTDEQKQYWLPRLAAGDEIPCFALTGPRAGSDAGAIPDSGIVCKDQWEGEEITGIRLNWDKRYITLAPVATVLGLAFKLYDPDHLIGDQDEYGITAALIPTDTPGVEIGRRHLPLHTPFQNGPTQGKDVFVPLDAIIGGVERAGQGWRMLMEQLAAGRGISLPSESQGSAQAAVYSTGAYSQIRKQFNLPIARFEGVEEVIARMAGKTYIINSGVSSTVNAISAGENPAVPSAIMKYHCTELGRSVCNDAMDIQGGKAIMSGPTNYLVNTYDSVPISITVEGANILTRSLIIFGQGAVRCHPFVLKEMEAAANPDFEAGLRDFDHLLFRHVGAALSNAARSFVMALTHARYTSSPRQGPTKRYFQHVNRYSSAFALASDTAMLVLGGDLKRRETLSARLGDVFSYIYLASIVLKHHEDQGLPENDLPLVEWSCRTLLYLAQEQLHLLLRNFPNRIVASLLRLCIFPRGRTYFPPSDELGQQIVTLVTRPTEARERLCSGIYKKRDSGNPLGLLQAALETTEDNAPLSRKLRDALRNDVISGRTEIETIHAAREAGVLTPEEAELLIEQDRQIMELINVDDFAAEDIGKARALPEAALADPGAKDA
ncbi:MAG: acyl-CoA dehydrogenase [Gammaproteobacteria bacterium]|nr:acyl-CoA dehydrogenase [Gammaproteobacteria bacterium]MDP6617637.1 acyl-CoA dehydrogenase [Gammaproteobacteria bacterium]MDP6694514.1 acyl-CoA dehydrogenase [Gammaproteobacteria bacterium]MDP7041632.1 acyl-CoA dehydrogenase [Gammaproteobacteria bacterium]